MENYPTYYGYLLIINSLPFLFIELSLVSWIKFKKKIKKKIYNFLSITLIKK